MVPLQEKTHRGDRQQRSDGDRLEDLHRIGQGSVAPEAPVEAGPEENQRLDGKDRVDRRDIMGGVVVGKGEVETEQVRQGVRDKNKYYIEEKNEKTPSTEHRSAPND